MADPVTMIGGAGIAASAGSSLLGAFGSMFSGNAQSQSYQYQAGVARINKQIELQNADYERSVGEIQAQTEGMKTRYQIGETKTIQSGSGIDINSGSSADVRASELEIGQHDEATIRANAARKAWGFETEAASEEAKAQMDEYAAKTSKTTGLIGALGSILGGASSVSSKWLQGNQIGMWG